MKLDNKLAKDNKKFQAAKFIINELKNNGHEGYIVGGAVRDLCMNIEPDEFDISTSATPKEIQEIFKKTKPVGQSFGVVLVIIENMFFEVATFREDMEYLDGRHPVDVKYTKNPKIDVMRRDFTVNGLMLNPDTSEVIDFCDGIKDIKEGILRTIGAPKERFSEDNLRILRAIRFSNKYNLKIEEKTKKEIVNMSDNIINVSIERIREEFVKIITNKNPGEGVKLLSDYGLMKIIIPEIDDLKGVKQPDEFHPEGDVFVHTCLVLDRLRDNHYVEPVLALGGLLHDIGKPSTYTNTDRIRFNRHEYVGAILTEKICKRLKFSNKQIADIKSLVSEHMKFGNIKEMKKSTFKRFISMENFDLHLKLHKADCLASHGDLSLLDFTINKISELKNEPIKPKPLISGDDLISLGLKPGPRFKEILSEIFDEQLEGNILNHKEGISFASKLIKKYEN
tara:strand:- start:106 stop:1461 length:1356 start_codon:yes stop_codon:yes gene_type:complete